MPDSPSGHQDEIRGVPSPHIRDIEYGAPHEGETGQGVVLATGRGRVHAILHQPDRAAEKAVMWVWGARGGYAGPADGIFSTLAEEFTPQGITSLRLNYQQPGVYAECVLDALCGLKFLKELGCSRVALVGHSFGGAVVISTAALSDQVIAVVALSPQTYGAQGAAQVSPRPLLIVHGLADTRLPPLCSRQIHQWAREPKDLVLYPGAEHGLRECADELRDLLRGWIPEKLGEGS